MPSWIFLEKQPDRSATGDAFRNSFEGEDPVSTLGRESIQNAADENLPDQVLRVTFTHKSKVDLSELITSDFSAHAKASGVIGELDPINAEVLYVEDFGTKGLVGSMSDMDSNFYKLMGQLGGSDKKAGQGGSFGYGKAACILNSRCWTVLAYTVTEEGSALFATTYMDQHSIGEGYTGLGWYCGEESTASHPNEIVNQEADALAEKFGIPRAKTGEKGTSLLIPYPSLNMADLKKAIEYSWWPKLVDHTLSVEIVTGGVKRVPQPEKNPELLHHIQLYEAIQKKGKALNGDIMKPLTLSGRPLGIIAMRFVGDASEIDEDRVAVVGRISLMRDPRMVVSYYRWSQGPRGDLVGVFVADPAINDDLQRTETLRHDEWSLKSTRATPAQRELARQVLDRIRREYRQYLNQYEPPASQDEASLRELRRMFGGLFGKKGKSGGGKKAESISIRHQVAEPVGDGNQLKLVGSAQIMWTGKGQVTLDSGVKVILAESDVSTSGDEVPVRIWIDDMEASGETPSLCRQVKTSEAFEIRFESDPYEPEWTATATFTSSIKEQYEN